MRGEEERGVEGTCHEVQEAGPATEDGHKDHKEGGDLHSLVNVYSGLSQTHLSHHQ